MKSPKISRYRAKACLYYSPGKMFFQTFTYMLEAEFRTAISSWQRVVSWNLYNTLLWVKTGTYFFFWANTLLLLRQLVSSIVLNTSPVTLSIELSIFLAIGYGRGQQNHHVLLESNTGDWDGVLLPSWCLRRNFFPFPIFFVFWNCVCRILSVLIAKFFSWSMAELSWELERNN